MADKNEQTDHRDSGTGRFVSDADAKARPETTTTETTVRKMPPAQQKSTVRAELEKLIANPDQARDLADRLVDSLNGAGFRVGHA